MAPGDEDDFPSIGNKCFEICKLLGNQGLAFKFKLTFGTFCFSLDTMEIRTSPAPGPVKKKKSQSAVNRDKRRRIEFLQRKAAASSQGASLSVLDISSSGPGNPSPVDIQGASAAQRNTQDINQTSDTSGLKIRMEKSGAGDWSISPSLSRRNSVSSKADPVPDGKENVKKAPKVKKPLPCRNCHQPFLQNHQCDEGYYLDDDDQFETVDDLINLAEEDETDPGAEFFESYPEEEDDEEVDENQLDEEDYEPTRESLTQRVEHHNENVHLMRKSNFMLKAKIDRLYVSIFL